jgi:hypothetical protein
MTVPFLAPFSAGQILTSDDMNETAEAVNSLGLFIVKNQTVGSAVASVTVTGAFSSDFDRYKIVYLGGTASTAGTQISCRMGSTTTGYKTNLVYQVWSSATVLGANGGTSNFQFTGGNKLNAVGGDVYVDFELLNPFATKYTYMTTQLYGGDTTSGSAQGVLTNSTSYTSFVLLPDAGTLTGGTIRVYGYRNSYS